MLLLSSPEKNVQINSVFFWLYSQLTHLMHVEPKISYHLFQFFSFTIFTNAVLRFLQYDLVKYLIIALWILPVFVPLYFLVQIKMGFALTLFIWVGTLQGVRSNLMKIVAVLTHLYALALFYFTKENFIKNAALQILLLISSVTIFILIIPKLGYEILFVLGHQAKLNLVNSLFLFFTLIALVALFSRKKVLDNFNVIAFVFGGFVIYFCSYILQYPVLGIRTLELFSCILLIWIGRLFRQRRLVYFSPFIFLATAYHTYYMYFVFGLFL